MVYLSVPWSNFIRRVMKKTLLIISICFCPLLQASEYGGESDTGIILSVNSNHSGIKLGIQNHSIKDLADYHNPYLQQNSISSLRLRKTWSDSSEWKLYSTHLISSPLASSPADYPSTLTLGQHAASSFSINNRLSLRKRYSSALVLTPGIGLNMLSTTGILTNSSLSNFYPIPILGQNNNEHLYSINTGIDMNGLFSENWGYSAELEFAYLANNNGIHAWKSEALLFYQWQSNSKLLVGYKYIDGQGSEQRNIHLYPVIDFLWSW